MGFFDSLSDTVLGGNSNAEDVAESAGLNLGNIFLPGGMRGGKIMEQTPGGFGGSPLNQQDWQSINNAWGTIRGAANYGDISQQHLPQGLSPEASQFISNNWGNIRRAANFGDINWNAGIVGTPGYAQPAAGAPGAAAPGNEPLGDLEPARGMFANLAAGEAGKLDGTTPGTILELLRTQAQPFEQQAQNRLNNNLFMRGRLGANDSATGEAYRGFSRGLAEADTGRQLQAFGLFDQLQTGALKRSLGATQGAGMLTELSTLPFDMALKLAMARSQTALGQAGAMNASSPMSLVDAGSQLFGGGGMFGPGGRWGPVK